MLKNLKQKSCVYIYMFYVPFKKRMTFYVVYIKIAKFGT
jgi:hypothetical protein